MTAPQPNIDVDESMTEAEYEAFAVAAQEREARDMETLLHQGLYGQKMPKALRGQKAANAFQNAFELIGGVPRLALWADKNPSAFFALYSKLIPSTVQAQVNGQLEFNVRYSNPAFNQPLSADSDSIVDVQPKVSQGSQG